MTDQALQGKTALVTGAASGIGEATAKRLATAGARVALVARRRDRLEALASELAEKTGRSDAAVAVAADLTDEDGIERAYGETRSALGHIDILANIAGLMVTAPLNGSDTRPWRNMVEINLMSVILLTCKALPAMVERGAGDIINISSVAARVTGANFAVYCATKYGVAAFTDSLRKELLDTGVRVTEMLPGNVSSELAGHTTDAKMLKFITDWQKKVLMEPENIADGILYAVTRPPKVAVSEMIVRPANQEL